MSDKFNEGISHDFCPYPFCDNPATENWNTSIRDVAPLNTQTYNFVSLETAYSLRTQSVWKVNERLPGWSLLVVIKVHPALDLCTVMEKRDAVNCNGDKMELCDFFCSLRRDLAPLKSLGEGPDEIRDLSVWRTCAGRQVLMPPVCLWQCLTADTLRHTVRRHLPKQKVWDLLPIVSGSLQV